MIRKALISDLETVKSLTEACAKKMINDGKTVNYDTTDGFPWTDIDTEEDFLAWVQSPDFAEGHRSAMEAANEHPEPLPLTAELWSYIVELQADGSTG